MKKIRQIALGCSLMFLVALLSSCQNEIIGENTSEEESTDIGQIRFIHAASSTSGLDWAYLDQSDNNYYLIQGGTTYNNQYGYFNFYVGDRTVIAYSEYTDIAVSAAIVPLSVGEKFSVIAVDYEATIDPTALVLEDTLATPPAGYAYVRFIHAGTDGETIEIAERDSSEKLSIINHLDNSGYMQLEARTFEIEVRLEQSKQLILQANPLTFLSGNRYSIIFSGSTSGLTLVDFNAKVFRETSI